MDCWLSDNVGQLFPPKENMWQCQETLEAVTNCRRGRCYRFLARVKFCQPLYSKWELFQACLVGTSPVQKCGGWETKEATWANIESTEKVGRLMCYLEELWTVREQSQLKEHWEAGRSEKGSLV